MGGLAQDLRYALRQLGKSPGFTAVALVTLALGVGANTGVFTLVNAALLKSLPVPNPEQLYLVVDNPPQGARFSYPMFEDARATMPRGSELAGMSWPATFYASFGGGQPEMVTGQLVTGNYFQMLETHSELGRLLGEEDDRVIGGSPVAVISYACWERRFGRDPNVVGRKLVVNSMPLQVVGVAAQGFWGTHVGAAPEFWSSTAMQAAVRYAQHYSESGDAKSDQPWLPQRNIRWLRFMVRAKNHKAESATSTALNQVFQVKLEQEATGIKDPQERKALLRERLLLQPGGHGMSTAALKDFSQPLLALMAMVGIILLIACANLANLLLARAAAREREMALRLSIGASRARLVRQLLVECILLSVCGTLLGSVFAYWLCRILPRWASGKSSPIPLSLAPDARVFWFSAAVAVLTGIVFGLAPAFAGTRVEPMHALKAGGRAAPGGGARWTLKQTLVALQVALSLVLLVGAGLFMRTLQNFTRLDAGFDRDHLVNVWFDTHLGGYSQAQLPSLYRRLIAQVETLPGVRSAALVSCEIASGCGDASDIYLPGVPHANGETDAQRRQVSQEFFATAGIPLIAGRGFADFDTEKSPAVAVVNQAFVREFLHDQNPLGQYFGYDGEHPYRIQIVGMVKDSRVNDIHESAPPTIYHSLAQDAVDVESLLVRSAADPAQLISQVREAVRSVDPNLPIGGAGTVAELISSSLAQQRLIARLTSILGALALGLACLGLYGVMSYTVAQRTSELGIRLALGATPRGVLWLVMRQSVALAGAGIVAGLFLSLLTAHTVSSLLFGLSPYDPATITAAATVLLAVSLASGLRPAWRAARVDPMVALRYE
ncbi:MAG TPA: ABC transporter permease [Terriglobales bacterium]|nr:ABC transporter permease [Terriglobales bacterium]